MRHAHNGLEEVIVHGTTWLLLISGVRVAVAHGAGAGDAGNLSRTTHIPSQTGLCCGWAARSWPSSAAGSGWSCDH